MNRLMDTKHTRPIRSRVCAPLSGDVVELGFGTGLNLPHLPPTVVVLRAVDPLERGRSLASERVESSSAPVEFVGLDGQDLPLDDESVDAALATWTLCSIPDPVAAVREIRRVLRPGAEFHFVEHGCSPDPRVLKWQKRLNPLQRRVACGCNLDRDIPAIIEAGGLTIGQLDTYYAEGDPKIFGWTFEGTARLT
ncbi:MAG: class I SAM-dependent methyltransferase [Ilumatobacteraceae bacterium]